MQKSDQQQQLNEEELTKLFDKCLYRCNQFEELGGTDDEVIETIESLQSVQQNIIKLAMFSPNEEFTEIPTENLKQLSLGFINQQRFILLPYFLGECFGRIQSSFLRKKNLQFSDIYLREFVKLVDHYGLLLQQIKKQWKKLSENIKEYKPERDDRIQNLKETKELKSKLMNLEKLDDDKSKREVIGLVIFQKLYKVLDILPLIQQEQEILEYKSKLETDNDVKEKHQQQMDQVIPKMKVWNVPKPQVDQESYMLNNKQGSMCHDCKFQSESEKKQNMIAQVWQPAEGSLPTMTMDEFADMEIKSMQDQEKQQKRAAEMQKKYEDEQSEEQKDDQQTLQDRHWDNWKDDHEKGAGNKQGR